MTGTRKTRRFGLDDLVWWTSLALVLGFLTGYASGYLRGVFVWF